MYLYRGPYITCTMACLNARSAQHIGFVLDHIFPLRPCAPTPAAPKAILRSESTVILFASEK